MIVHVRMFAAAKDAIRTDTLTITLPVGATVNDLRRELASSYPELETILHHSLFAVDNEYVSADHRLVDQATIACIPPVSGG